MDVGVLKIHNNDGDQSRHVAIVSAFIPLGLDPKAPNHTLTLQVVNRTPENTGIGGDVAIAGVDYWDIVLFDDGV